MYKVSLLLANIFIRIETTLSININVSYKMCCSMRIYIVNLPAICRRQKAYIYIYTDVLALLLVHVGLTQAHPNNVKQFRGTETKAYVQSLV